jgi:uncharacterized protein (TIGR03503 family)
MRYSLIFLVAIALLGVSSARAQEELAGGKQSVSEVRILIDISGSMKKNDPNNLRAPALKLITQLLPEGSRAGVWTFGQYVNMLVPAAEVNKGWKVKANEAVKAINSAGQYTNIEGVLKDASWDWNKPDSKISRNIIFLTDGMLDISKDASVDQAARRRVLDEMLPRLKSNGVAIHTVALSAEADKPFLRQLSAATSGRYEEVANAADLERVFLRMFEKSVPVESAPLTDNKVLVDNSINELTLLVFRKEGAKEATLKTPDGKEIDQKTKLESVHWQHEERYDLITLDKPMAGEWKVNADLDPDNRVMIVTDLSVRASRLPNMMMAGDRLPYFVELHDKDKLIDKPQFLDFVTVMLNRNLQSKLDKSVPLEDNGKEEDAKGRDGRFSGAVGGDLKPGDYDYELVVNGTTFKRSKRYLVQVVDRPVAVNVTEVSKGDPAHYTLTLTPYAELIKPESLLIDAKATKVGGETTVLTIPRTGPNEWRLDMDVREGDRYEIALSVQAERPTGQGITADLGSYILGAGTLDTPKEPPVAAEPAPEEAVKEETPPPAEQPAPPAEHAAPEHAPEEAAPEGEEAAAEAESPNWLFVILKVVGVNGVLLLIGFFVYRKWFRKTEPQPEENAEKETEKK